MASRARGWDWVKVFEMKVTGWWMGARVEIGMSYAKVENFFCKGPNSKHFQHWGPYDFCQLLSSAMVVEKQLQIHL